MANLLSIFVVVLCYLIGANIGVVVSIALETTLVSLFALVSGLFFASIFFKPVNRLIHCARYPYETKLILAGLLTLALAACLSLFV